MGILKPRPSRRDWLRLAGALLLPAPLVAQDGWRQFRGNPQLTGVADGPLPPDPKVQWTYEAGDPIESSAAIADGAVYAGCQSGHLLAVDFATGKLRWKYKAVDLEGIGESSPAVAGGRVYIGDLAGVFHAVDAQNGKALWTFKTSNEIKSSPVVVGDRVLIGSYDGTLYSLHAASGALLWKVRTDNYIHGTPAVAGGATFISGCDEVFRAIRLSDGRELYHFPSGGYTGASPAIVDDVAYYGTFGNEVVAANLKTKALIWRFEHPQRKFPFYSSAAVRGDRLVVGGRDKFVYALSVANGQPIWQFGTRARVDSSPVISGDRVFIGSNDGRLYGLDLAAGTKVWEFEAGSGISASPAVAAGRLVVGAQDGRLYCFG